VFPYGENNCCSGLYDVERQAWDTRTFGGAAVWSPTGNYIASTSFNENSAELILHDWDQGTERVLYTIQTYDYRGILSNLEWSPDEQAIFFVESSSLIGGNNNYARVIYLPLNQVYSVSDDFDTWYVAYSPLWSPTGRYLLISLQVTATEPFAGDDTEMGDLYLFDAHTGERHRITNTPFQYEASFGWSEDGETIIYVVPQTIEVSLTNALNLGDSVTDLNEIPEMPILQQQGFLLISTSSDEQWQVWKDDNCVMLSLNVETEASFQLGVSGQDCQPTLFIEWRPVPPPDTAD
jgi:Tol biopolymer transport system component